MLTMLNKTASTLFSGLDSIAIRLFEQTLSLLNKNAGIDPSRVETHLSCAEDLFRGRDSQSTGTMKRHHFQPPVKLDVRSLRLRRSVSTGP